MPEKVRTTHVAIFVVFKCTHCCAPPPPPAIPPLNQCQLRVKTNIFSNVKLLLQNVDCVFTQDITNSVMIVIVILQNSLQVNHG